MELNGDRNRKKQIWAKHMGATRSRGIQGEKTQDTGLTLLPPPRRRVHVPHNIQWGGVVGVLEAPQDRSRRDGRPPERYLFRDPWQIRQFRMPWRSREIRGPWRSRQSREPWWSRELRGPWWSRELRGPWWSRELSLRPGLYGRSPITPPQKKKSLGKFLVPQSLRGPDAGPVALPGPDVGTGALSGLDVETESLSGLAVGTGVLSGLNLGTGALSELNLGTGAISGLDSGSEALTGPDVRTGALSGLHTGTGALSGLGSESEALSGPDMKTTALLGLDVETGALSGLNRNRICRGNRRSKWLGNGLRGWNRQNERFCLRGHDRRSSLLKKNLYRQDKTRQIGIVPMDKTRLMNMASGDMT